jgi:hypothetical protein
LSEAKSPITDVRSARPSLALAIAIGAVAGGLSGLFGVGGGILIVPALALFTRMEQRLAHGTSLAATGPLALAGLVGYAIAGEVDWTIALLLLIGSLVGAVIGTSLLKGLSTRWLTYGFAVLLVLTAVRMLIETPAGSGRAAIGVGGAAGLAGIGLFTGSIAGLMGVGGGIVMVPAQMMLFSIPAVLAKGTSLAVIVPTAALGTFRNLRNGNADLVTALRVGASGAVFSYLASQVSLGLDARVSSVLFGLLLLAAATRMVVRQRPASEDA